MEDMQQVEDRSHDIERFSLVDKDKEAVDPYVLHKECKKQCRSSVILHLIESHPETLAVEDEDGCLPLHWLVSNHRSTIELVMMMMEKHPAALEHQNLDEQLPIHIECVNESRSPIIAKFIELYPASLAIGDMYQCLPLHLLLESKSSSIENALTLIEEYPAALKNLSHDNELPLHFECENQCRSAIISKCIELYPEALGVRDKLGNLPLHRMLRNLVSIETTFMLIEQYPAALQQPNDYNLLPIHIECTYHCRPTIIQKFIELDPESLYYDEVISTIMERVNRSNFPEYVSHLSIIFTARPLSLYNRDTYTDEDIRADPTCRRRILHLLPQHVFDPTHEADYRDLNWQPRAAMMILLSQMKKDKQTAQSTTFIIDY
jgi:hypothetical protein